MEKNNVKVLCVVALSRNLKLTTALDRAITQTPCYVPFYPEIMDYLINKYKGNIDLKKSNCECCGNEYETNINRTRCSKKCADTMKNRRYKSNALFRVKYDKETMVRTTVDIFGYVRSAVY